MINYKIIKSSKGTRYMKDNKFVKKEEIPQFILDGHDPVADCIVCELPGSHKRTVLGMIVALCDNDYYTATYGSLAGLIRDKLLIGKESNVHEEEPQPSTT